MEAELKIVPSSAQPIRERLFSIPLAKLRRMTDRLPSPRCHSRRPEVESGIPHGLVAFSERDEWQDVYWLQVFGVVEPS